MDARTIDAAARQLVAARAARRPGARLPASCRPADVDAGLAIQRRVTQMLDSAIGGWKCSVPTAERTVAAAPIFAPTIVNVAPCPILPIAGKARVEPEIAFVLARDLPPRAAPYDEADVRAAIGEARLVLELMGPRYADPAAVTFPELLADSIANQGLFVGPVLSNPVGHPLDAFAIVVDGADGTLITRDGRHSDGDPLRPLYWLANFLAAGGYGEGASLKAGQIVTTGSYCGVVDVPLETALVFRYGDLGTLDVQFSAAG
ncbi:MAG TPA: 2-keto-4-pentenoate hydratase [Casimicrobiaceae bacterium]|nr:2-keto-4-pentenoate hydratase [Casimicrobiaceae bacterium]